MTDHTPEPYRATYTDLPYGPDMSEGWTVDGPEGSVCTLDCPFDEREAMAKRIAAALNACAGIPTAQLQVGSVAELVAAADKVLQPADGSDEPPWDLKAAIAAFQKD